RGDPERLAGLGWTQDCLWPPAACAPTYAARDLGLRFPQRARAGGDGCLRAPRLVGDPRRPGSGPRRPLYCRGDAGGRRGAVARRPRRPLAERRDCRSGGRGVVAECRAAGGAALRRPGRRAGVMSPAGLAAVIGPGTVVGLAMLLGLPAVNADVTCSGGTAVVEARPPAGREEWCERRGGARRPHPAGPPPGRDSQRPPPRPGRVLPRR